MARHPFGLTESSWTFDRTTVSATANVAVATQATILFYNTMIGGSQHTDLSLDASGLSPVSSLTTSDGTDGNITGDWPNQVYGPDGVTEMWASAAGGPRVLLVATDAAKMAQADQIALGAHTAAVNPHGTGFGDLADANLPPIPSRSDGHLLVWDAASQKWVMLPPSASAGAVMLNPPLSGGVYVGNVVTPPLASQGPSGKPWLSMQQPESSDDDNPDGIQLFGTNPISHAKVKTTWFNGNNELRAAPSTIGRIAARVFESYEVVGASTGRFFELSTNPTLTINREPLLGGYGTGSSTKPGWIEATRILSALQGIAAGGNFNSLSQCVLRGRKTTAGAPTSSSWSTGDWIIDSNGAVWLCTTGGTPGTWAGAGAPSAYADMTPGTNVSLSTKHAASQLERGGDSVRLRGSVVAGATITSGSTIATITAAHRPVTDVNLGIRTSAAGLRLTIAASTGIITAGANLANTDIVWFDSVTYDLL